MTEKISEDRPERRQNERITKLMDVILSREPIREGMTETFASCRDISRTGIKLELSEIFTQGEQLYLRCFDNNAQNYIDVQCRVIWHTLIKEKPGLFYTGLEFQDLKDEDYQKILSF